MLTPKRKQIIEFVLNFGKDRAPYHSEIAKHLGVSQATAQWHIERMRELGMIRSEPKKYGSIEVLWQQ